MINNRQVNLWRGESAPPTLFHVWITKDNVIKVYDDEKKEWVSVSSNCTSDDSSSSSGPNYGTTPDVPETPTFITWDAIVGEPRVESPEVGDNSDRIATTEWVNTRVDSMRTDIVDKVTAS
jgi:hypothetical protein